MPPDAATWSDRGLSARLPDVVDLRWFDRLDSTNRYVLDVARAGRGEGLVAVADEQTAGRGRLGRRWEAPPGASLLVSVLLRRPGVPPQRLVMAVGLALAEAVETVAGIVASLKWPNDLVVGDRKLAGILAESDGEAVVVGAGCNVNWSGAADAVPDDVAAGATACDLEAGHPVDREELLVEFLGRLVTRLDALDDVAADYRERLDTIGRRVRVVQADGEWEGDAVDVDPDGALVVHRDDGGSSTEAVTVHVGDIVHLRTAP